MSDHGYSRYSHGCRCQVCTDAKRAYIARRRQAAQAAAGRGELIPGQFTHGTRSGFEEHGCRCAPCKYRHGKRYGDPGDPWLAAYGLLVAP